MWFKQVQLFRITQSINSSVQAVIDKLEPLAFQPCLPSMESSIGWVAPVEDEGEPLAKAANGCIMLCMQIEEKILPASVVNQALKDKIKMIEQSEARRIRKKEKLSFKDDVMVTLLPRAFTKLNRLYAYIDTRNQWLLINTTSASRTEMFLSLFKKAFGECVESYDVAKPAAVLTSWLKDKNYPTEFAIEKACVLQDPNQQHRVIRCQQQDLFDESIQSLVKDGCAVIQLALNWHDKLTFVLAEDFSIRSIRLAEEDIVEIQEEMESKQHKFAADLIMMGEMFAGLINDLLTQFTKKADAETTSPRYAMVG